MPLTLDTLEAVHAAPFDTLIDVRSPAEYAEDRIPGAISLPALSDAERARVGTIYARQSPFDARKIGAALVARNVAAHLDGPLAGHDGGWKPLLYCWRGGQRSGAFRSILAQIGWRADVIEGGYRSYRRLVVDMLHDRPLPHRLILLDGNTGTAKTDLLHRLSARGVQVVDLEGLAAHRGSLFGAVAAPQPAQKGFESALAHAFTRADPARPVVLEAESSKIGERLLPPALWKAMCAAPRIRLAAPLAARARYLARSYADLTADPAALAATLDRLIPFHGRARVAEWQALAGQGAHDRLAAGLMQAHYDPRYDKARQAHPPHDLARIDLPALEEADLDRAAGRIARIAEAFAPA